MKKQGFTLAELLIVLGVTGVIAAALLSAVSTLTPDKNKIAYLKVHDELINNVRSLTANTSLYPVCLEEGDNNIGCAEHPLINTSAPVLKKFENYKGDTKLCKLLAFSMGANDSCKADNYTYSDTNFASSISYTTQNGMQWKVVPLERTIGTGSATFQTDIYVDVDSSKKSPNCMFDSVKCKNPDRFKFLIAADGSVIPADPKGISYLNTRKSFNKNKKQKIEGNIATSLDSSLRKFSYKPCLIATDQNLICPSGYTWDSTTQSCVEQKQEAFKGLCESIPDYTTFGNTDTSDDEYTIALLRHVYQVLSNAFDAAVAEYGEPKTWNLGYVSSSATTQDFLNSQKMFNAMRNGFSISKDCGKYSGCFTPSTASYYSGRDSHHSYNAATHRYKILTSDNISMAFQAYNQDCDCKAFMGNAKSSFEGFCGKIFVDIDGPDKGDYAYGKDLFTFFLTNNGIVLEGSIDIVSNGYSQCFSTGDFCAGYVLEKCNRDYLY